MTQWQNARRSVWPLMMSNQRVQMGEDSRMNIQLLNMEQAQGRSVVVYRCIILSGDYQGFKGLSRDYQGTIGFLKSTRTREQHQNRKNVLQLRQKWFRGLVCQQLKCPFRFGLAEIFFCFYH